MKSTAGNVGFFITTHIASTSVGSNRSLLVIIQN